MPILDLHERFQCSGGWGIERAFNKWVCKQPWRTALPMNFFERLLWNKTSKCCYFELVWLTNRNVNQSKKKPQCDSNHVRFDVPVPLLTLTIFSLLLSDIERYQKTNSILLYISCEHFLLSKPEWIVKVPLTEQQNLLGHQGFCKQSVMPPHELVSSLFECPHIFFPIFTGEQKYWEENIDLWEALGMEETWPTNITFFLLAPLKVTGCICWTKREPTKYFSTTWSQTLEDTSHCLPLRIYGDGADAQANAHFEMYTVLPVLSVASSTLDTRLLYAVRNTDKTSPESRKKILETLAWSFEAMRNFVIKWYALFLLCTNLFPTTCKNHTEVEHTQNHSMIQKQFWISIIWGCGRHPSCDPWGREFSETYHPSRFRKANTELCGGYTFVLDGVQGDADFIAAMFGLNRPSKFFRVTCYSFGFKNYLFFVCNI